MSQILRVLQVEDSESDAAMVVRALRAADYKVEAQRVETAAEMRTALARESFHVVLADYQLPRFDAPGALAVLQESGQDLPFIVVSGKMGEDAAVAMMKAGANDYVMKDRLTRLAPAVERELREAQGRRERGAAQRALRESEERFRTLFLKTPIGVGLADTEARLVDVNEAFCQMLGYSRDELLRLTLIEITPSEDRPQLRAAFDTMVKGGRASNRIERRCLKKDGTVLWVSVTSAAMRAPDGSLLCGIGMIEDISERRQIEARRAQFVGTLQSVNEMSIELAASHDTAEVFTIIAEKLREITSAVVVAVSSYQPDVGELVVEWIAVPPGQKGLLARAGALLGRQLLGFRAPVQEDVLLEIVKSGIKKFPGVHDVTFGAIPGPVARALEEALGLGDIYALALAQDDRVLATCVIAMRREAEGLSQDLHSILARVCTSALSRAKASEALRASEARFSTIFHASPQAIALARLKDDVVIDVNQAWSALTGWSREEIVGRTAFERNISADPARRDRLLSMLAQQGTVRGFEIQLRAKSGELRDVLLSAGRIEVAGEACLLTMATDISDRKRAEQTLRDSEERFRGVFQGVQDGILLAEIDSRAFVMANRAICEMLGYSEQELLGLRMEDIHPAETTDALSEVFQRQITGDQRLAPGVVVRRKDGSTFVADINSVPVLLGGRRGLLGVFRDMTAYNDLEQRLRQAQKMEAVGQLAGGIAHDFNNILAVILGHSEIEQRRLRMPGPQYRRIEEIRKAAERGASLTRQLLAFSRKQVLEPRVLELNALVQDMVPMLRRLIGEDVELVTHLGDGLGQVMADEGQMQQVLMNLAVNARDAMPGGGTLTIATAHERLHAGPAGPEPETSPGDYVVLTVRDTGHGMDAATRARVFEPFFTTKEAGKGTGLGLATVYGVVKQSGGHLHVESAPGGGATFRVCLPQIEGRVEPRPPEVRRGGLTGGSETIMLLEDDASLRSLEQEILEAAGYRVIVAAQPEEALATLDEVLGGIDLLVTDVVLPGMSGPEVAAKLLERRPELKVLYVSGYAADAVTRRGISETGSQLLDKPFTTEAILREVRAALDEPKKVPPPSERP